MIGFASAVSTGQAVDLRTDADERSLGRSENMDKTT
jgi:hypothetical protein